MAAELTSIKLNPESHLILVCSSSSAVRQDVTS